MKRPIALLAFASATLLTAACTEQKVAAAPEPGKYSNTVKSTDAYGTTTEKKVVKQVDVDEYGNTRVVEQTKTSRDPEGLFNKTTTTTSRETVQQQY